jgi:hypothetical protein
MPLRSLVRPAVLIAVAALHYLHGVPTAGNDAVLEGLLLATGIALGTLAALTTHVRVDDAGQVVSRAGGIAAALWVAGFGARMAFVWAVTHGAGDDVARFSAAHAISGESAWTAALVLMAIAEAATRLIVLHARGLRMRTATPALAY